MHTEKDSIGCKVHDISTVRSCDSITLCKRVLGRQRKPDAQSIRGASKMTFISLVPQIWSNNVSGYEIVRERITRALGGG